MVWVATFVVLIAAARAFAKDDTEDDAEGGTDAEDDADGDGANNPSTPSSAVLACDVT
jgi:hypothetical protein